MTEADGAHADAERLVREAEAAARAAAEAVPSRGWDVPRGDGAGDGGFEADLRALLGLLELLRASLPEDLARTLLIAVRDLLLAFVAIVEYAVRRLDED